MTLEWFVAFIGPILAFAGVMLGLFFHPWRRWTVARSDRADEKRVPHT